MKKTVVFLLITVCVILGISADDAEWKLGFYVDEFDDPTGEKFVYALVDGFFSNSATSKSAAPTRIIANVKCDPAPYVSFTFEPHEYSLERPVNSFYEKTVSEMKVKDDDNKIYSYKSGYDDLFPEPWNCFSSKDFLKVFYSTEKLKVILKVEGTTYRFDLKKDNLFDLLETIIDESRPELNIWSRIKFNEKDLSFYKQLEEVYDEMGIEKNFGTYQWKMLTKVSGEKGDYLVQFIVSPEDFIYNTYPTINFFLTDYSKFEKLSFETDNTSSVYSEIIFSNAGGEVVLKNREANLAYSDFRFIISSYLKLKEICEYGQINVRLVSVDYGNIDFVVDGAELLHVFESIEKENN